MKHMYSEEWKQVIKTYEAYKESISVFRNYDNNTADLSKSLRASSQLDCYYALEVLKYMPYKVSIMLLEDLFYVLIYSNVSYSFYAKSIILGLINNEIVKTIADLANKYAQAATDNEDIKTIAQLLYECKNQNSLYKDTYILFSKKYFDSLSKEDFFEYQEYKELI